MEEVSDIDKIKEKLKNEILSSVTQSKLAVALGVDRRVVNRQLSGAFEKTSINKLIDMANGVGLSVDVVITKKED